MKSEVTTFTNISEREETNPFDDDMSSQNIDEDNELPWVDKVSFNHEMDWLNFMQREVHVEFDEISHLSRSNTVRKSDIQIVVEAKAELEDDEMFTREEEVIITPKKKKKKKKKKVKGERVTSPKFSTEKGKFI